MSHARQQIRDRIIALLDAVPTFNGRVTATRRMPVKDAGLPAVAVYTASEGGQEASQRQTLSRTQSRRLSVLVDVYGSDVAALDDQLDGYAVLVETALLVSPRLGDLVWDADLANTEVGLVEENVTEPMGLIRMRFDVTYRTRPGAPETIV